MNYIFVYNKRFESNINDEERGSMAHVHVDITLMKTVLLGRLILNKHQYDQHQLLHLVPSGVAHDVC